MLLSASNSIPITSIDNVSYFSLNDFIDVLELKSDFIVIGSVRKKEDAKYLEENSVSFILDKKNVLVGKTASDITNIIIKQLDNKLPKIEIN